MTEPDRKMAFVAKILELEAIKGADKVVLATVLGWKVVVKKDEFKVGDLCIYYTLMSLLDDTNPDFDFLKDKGKMKPLKTRKIRGVLSQGLVTAVDVVKHYGQDPLALKEGDDVTVVLNVKKFVAAEESQAYSQPGSKAGAYEPYPGYLPRTDEERIQNIPEMLEKLRGRDIVVTRKEDGTSATFILMKGEFLICSRNYVRKVVDSSEEPDLYVDADKKFKVGESMRAFGKNLAVQGEIVGPGISKNRLGLKERDFHVFNIYMIDEHRYVAYDEYIEICEKLHLNTAPLLYRGKMKEEWMKVENVLKFAESIEYAKGTPAEGIVVKTNEPGKKSRISFKAVSNIYLLKHGG